jgi:hypothetical protein
VLWRALWEPAFKCYQTAGFRRLWGLLTEGRSRGVSRNLVWRFLLGKAYSALLDDGGVE